MDSTLTMPANFILRIEKEVQIEAPASVVFETILEQSGPGFSSMDGTPMNLRLEPRPGGRWFRDLGNNTGHFWGHVQVIKPPKILEIVGPMFMSYAVAGHLQYKLAENAGVTTLSLSHHAIGEIDQKHREGVNKGWEQFLGKIKDKSER